MAQLPEDYFSRRGGGALTEDEERNLLDRGARETASLLRLTATLRKSEWKHVLKHEGVDIYRNVDADSSGLNIFRAVCEVRAAPRGACMRRMRRPLTACPREALGLGDKCPPPSPTHAHVDPAVVLSVSPLDVNAGVYADRGGL